MSNEFDTPQSRIEALFQNILGANNELLPPMSNIEKILLNMLGYEGVDIDPIQSRNEALLLQILEQGTGGGITPTGTKQITQNGTHDVTEYASAEVNVPNPSTGTLEIDENGTYDVTEKASVEVDVPTGIIPTGTKQISQNGNYDVTDFETAEVNVPQPSGSVNINANGTHDVSQYASANVNVSGWSTDGVADLTEPNGAITVNGVIQDHAFFKRTGITRITGEVTKVNAHGCSGCSRLTSIDLSNITSDFGGNAFENCTSLTRLESDTTANIATYMIANSGVEEIIFPYSGSVGNKSAPGSACRNATHLKRAFLSRSAMTAATSYQNTPADLFRNCPLLEVADIGWLAANQWKSMFTDCPALRTIITRGATKVPALSAWSEAVFGGVYTNPTESTIYIPKALYDHLGDGTELDFQSATNWSAAYAAGVTFAMIEGSIYEL